ncbi:MAG: ribosomal-protein-alanine N-acetyltransferase [Ruminococcaceae bacterium]|nr:ribosomal-protein-alanine N-acetyltransferase [Oscillospiraceae bacterium]
MSLSQNDIIVRDLTAAEYQLAAELESTALEEAWSAEAIAETVKRNGCYLGAFKDKSFLGHGGFTFAADEGYITNIAVSSQARRQGVATKILESMIVKAVELKLRFLSLEVRESNEAAVRLYQKSGFTVRGVRPKFYKNPTENAVIMTKDIEVQR